MWPPPAFKSSQLGTLVRATVHTPSFSVPLRPKLKYFIPPSFSVRAAASFAHSDADATSLHVGQIPKCGQ